VITYYYYVIFFCVLTNFGMTAVVHLHFSIHKMREQPMSRLVSGFIERYNVEVNK
jgi:hypothetical protein